MMCRSYAAWFVWLVIYPMAALAYGALAIGYYCWRGYAAFLPLCGCLGWQGMFFASGSLFSAGAPNARPYCCVGLLGCQPNSLSARLPSSPAARLPNSLKRLFIVEEEDAGAEDCFVFALDGLGERGGVV